MNLFYLEHLKQYLSSVSFFNNSIWRSNKNMISGVWLANDTLPENFVFNESINYLCRKNNASLWFHVELREGIGVESLNGESGMIQLRCHCKNSNSEFIREFKSQYAIGNDEYFSRRISNKADTFYIVGKNILKQQLVFNEMNSIIKSFMLRFSVLAIAS